MEAEADTEWEREWEDAEEGPGISGGGGAREEMGIIM